MNNKRLFDDWPRRYEQWFETPIGGLVKRCEWELIENLLQPQAGEKILDVGCGSGIFTKDILVKGAEVVGLDISLPMLNYARDKLTGFPFTPVLGNMLALPFKDEAFDKTVSITALEFIEDAQSAIDELFRVTRRGGTVVVATLNSLSPWAARRDEKTRQGTQHILENAFYRSPQELLALREYPGITETAVHFTKDADPAQAVETEQRGKLSKAGTGAFAAVKWEKV